jgi:cell wall-associated NlpC family hydrolase
MKRLLCILSSTVLLYSCSEDRPTFVYTAPITKDTVTSITTVASNISPLQLDTRGSSAHIETGKLTPAELIKYAETLKGVPYLYGSTDPTKGFDCSGFITYVFNHFNIAVPRQSVGFTDVDRPVELKDAKTGDLILFTGTDSTVRVVGHMGILKVDQGKEITFLHSTSGKDDGVTETPLNKYYQGRYMRTIRIFPQNDR